jgi:hypothetical protein
MRKLISKFAKRWLQKNCKHNYKEIERSYQEGYVLEKCKKCKLKTYSDL